MLNVALREGVIPAKAGIQCASNHTKRMDSRFHGNDQKTLFQTLYEFDNI